MIDITPKAVAKIRKTLEANHVEGGFRLGVVGGGCSGLSYKFKLEPQPRATDNIFEYEGGRYSSIPRATNIWGMTLDYNESLLESAFVFHNPNAKKSCSCGKSSTNEI